jgi:hypothetical protein
MIGDFLKSLNPLDMGSDDRLLFLEDPNVSVDLSVDELLVLELLKSSGDLILALVIEHHVIATGRIIDLKLGTHRFLYPTQQPPSNYHISNRVPALELANIVRPGLGMLNHLKGNWSEHLGPLWQRHWLLLICVVVVSSSTTT